MPHLKGSGTSKDLDTVVALIRLFKWEDIRVKVIGLMDNLSLITLSWDDRDNLIEILDYIANNNVISEFNFSIKECLILLSENMTNYFQIEAFSRLISKQNIYKDIISNSKSVDLEYYTKIQNSIDQSWSSSFDYYINQTANLNGIIKKEDLIGVIEKRKQEAKKMNERLDVNPSPAIDEYLFNYEEQLNKNVALLSEQETQIKSIQNDHDGINESLEINRLFNSDSSKEWDDLPF